MLLSADEYARLKRRDRRAIAAEHLERSSIIRNEHEQRQTISSLVIASRRAHTILNQAPVRS